MKLNPVVEIFDVCFGLFTFSVVLIWIFHWLPPPHRHNARTYTRSRRIWYRKLRLILLNSTWNDTYQDELCLECVGYTRRWFLHFDAHRCATTNFSVPTIYVRSTFQYWCTCDPSHDDAFDIQLTSFESRVPSYMSYHVLVVGGEKAWVIEEKHEYLLVYIAVLCISALN